MTKLVKRKQKALVQQTSENVPVNLFSNVDFPTEGKPTKPTRASPLFVTSNPSPAPPPPLDVGVSNSRRNFASLAWPNEQNLLTPIKINSVGIQKKQKENQLNKGQSHETHELQKTA